MTWFTTCFALKQHTSNIFKPKCRAHLNGRVTLTRHGLQQDMSQRREAQLQYCGCVRRCTQRPLGFTVMQGWLDGRIREPIVNASLRIMKGHLYAFIFQHPRLQNLASRLMGDWFAIETNICCIRINYCKRRNQYDIYGMIIMYIVVFNIQPSWIWIGYNFTYTLRFAQPCWFATQYMAIFNEESDDRAWIFRHPLLDRIYPIYLIYLI